MSWLAVLRKKRYPRSVDGEVALGESATDERKDCGHAEEREFHGRLNC